MPTRRCYVTEIILRTWFLSIFWILFSSCAAAEPTAIEFNQTTHHEEFDLYIPTKNERNTSILEVHSPAQNSNITYEFLTKIQGVRRKKSNLSRTSNTNTPSTQYYKNSTEILNSKVNFQSSDDNNQLTTDLVNSSFEVPTIIPPFPTVIISPIPHNKINHFPAVINVTFPPKIKIQTLTFHTLPSFQISTIIPQNVAIKVHETNTTLSSNQKEASVNTTISSVVAKLTPNNSPTFQNNFLRSLTSSITPFIKNMSVISFLNSTLEKQKSHIRKRESLSNERKLPIFTLNMSNRSVNDERLQKRNEISFKISTLNLSNIERDGIANLKTIEFSKIKREKPTIPKDEKNQNSYKIIRSLAILDSKQLFDTKFHENLIKENKYSNEVDEDKFWHVEKMNEKTAFKEPTKINYLKQHIQQFGSIKENPTQKDEPLSSSSSSLNKRIHNLKEYFDNKNYDGMYIYGQITWESILLFLVVVFIIKICISH